MLTYFLITDLFWGPPGGPQNGFAADAAIKKLNIEIPENKKTDPKLGPPGGPKTGSTWWPQFWVRRTNPAEHIPPTSI